MLTIYTTCRTFDHYVLDIIQTNALTSWTLLEPRPQILVMGNDPGSEEICDFLDLTYVPDIECSKYGTPMLDSMINTALEMAENPHILHVSSDIVLFQDTMDALTTLKNNFISFCGVVRKQIQKVIIPLDFDDDWENQAKRGTKWAPITSGDYYLYNRGFWKDIPPFIIGRCACDSWLFWDAMQRNCLVDITEAVDIIDYPHDYKFSDPKERMEEVTYNRELAGKDKAHICHANWKLTKNHTLLKN